MAIGENAAAVFSVRARRRVATVNLTIVSLTILFSILGSSGFLFVHAQASPEPFNNVQILVQTTGASSNFSSYTLTIYNSSGYAVASSDSSYPAFGAELPSGSYLFTVVAFQSSSYYYPYGYPTGSASYGGGSVAPSPTIAPKGYPLQEYGYTMQEINGSTTLNIRTSSLASTSTSKITVHVSYANGTAAANVYVQGSIVGALFYYWEPNANQIVMWNETLSDGTASLVVPNVPVEISAWAYIPVNLPKNVTTIQTTIGGEKVNVSVYWQPMYVGLAGSELTMPPQTSVNVVLHVQQPSYWVMPYSLNSASVSGGSAPSSQYALTQQQPVIGLGNKVAAPGQAQQTSNQFTVTTVVSTVTSYGTPVESPSSATIQALIVAVMITVTLSSIAIVLGLRRK